MQLVQVADLGKALSNTMDPDRTGEFNDEIAAFTKVVQDLLATVPNVSQVLFWDDQEGGDPTLDLDKSRYDQRDLLGTLESQGMVWGKSGMYYGATYYQRKWYPVGQFIMSLWYGGSPLNSAGGFYVIPVA